MRSIWASSARQRSSCCAGRATVVRVAIAIASAERRVRASVIVLTLSAKGSRPTAAGRPSEAVSHHETEGAELEAVGAAEVRSVGVPQDEGVRGRRRALGANRVAIFIRQRSPQVFAASGPTAAELELDPAAELVA